MFQDVISLVNVSGTNLSRSVSSVGEHLSEEYVSPTLPKRAETFGSFDNTNKDPGALNKVAIVYLCMYVRKFRIGYCVGLKDLLVQKLYLLLVYSIISEFVYTMACKIFVNLYFLYFCFLLLVKIQQFDY